MQRPAVLLTALLWLTSASALDTEAVTFENGGVRLAGTLTLPAGAGPAPAIVFVHGSGDHDRQGFLPYAERYAELGFASLAFDKRGTGDSGGSWIRSSLQDLADDVGAAVALLRTHPRIDGKRIGLWAISQGGWVAPLVIADDQDIAFLVVISGGGVTPLESELTSYENRIAQHELATDQRERARRVLLEYFWYLGTGRGRDRLLATLEAERDEPWYEVVAIERVLPANETGRLPWAWVANFDPLLSISRVHCPVLLLLGDRDRQNPSSASERRWRKGLALAGNDDLTVRIFEGAGHGIRLREQHHGPGRAPFAPGYHETMDDWLARIAVP